MRAGARVTEYSRVLHAWSRKPAPEWFAVQGRPGKRVIVCVRDRNFIEILDWGKGVEGETVSGLAVQGGDVEMEE